MSSARFWLNVTVCTLSFAAFVAVVSFFKPAPEGHAGYVKGDHVGVR